MWVRQQQMQDTQNEWVSISEYARRFNLSEITVRRRIKQGRVNAELKNGKYYISAPSSANIAKAEALPVLKSDYAGEELTRQTAPKNSTAINELAEICKNYLAELKSKETLTQKNHNAEIEVYKIQVEKLENEIASLKQQVDDLQLLIKMLDNK